MIIVPINIGNHYTAAKRPRHLSEFGLNDQVAGQILTHLESLHTDKRAFVAVINPRGVAAIVHRVYQERAVHKPISVKYKTAVSLLAGHVLASHVNLKHLNANSHGHQFAAMPAALPLDLIFSLNRHGEIDIIEEGDYLRVCKKGSNDNEEAYWIPANICLSQPRIGMPIDNIRLRAESGLLQIDMPVFQGNISINIYRRGTASKNSSKLLYEQERILGMVTAGGILPVITDIDLHNVGYISQENILEDQIYDTELAEDRAKLAAALKNFSERLPAPAFKELPEGDHAKFLNYMQNVPSSMGKVRLPEYITLAFLNYKASAATESNHHFLPHGSAANMSPEDTKLISETTQKATVFPAIQEDTVITVFFPSAKNCVILRGEEILAFYLLAQTNAYKTKFHPHWQEQLREISCQQLNFLLDHLCNNLKTAGIHFPQRLVFPNDMVTLPALPINELIANYKHMASPRPSSACLKKASSFTAQTPRSSRSEQDKGIPRRHSAPILTTSRTKQDEDMETDREGRRTGL